MKKIKVICGTIISYNENTRIAKAEINKNKYIKFSSTYFYAGMFSRVPQIGEQVEIHINKNKEILGVWTKIK